MNGQALGVMRHGRYIADHTNTAQLRGLLGKGFQNDFGTNARWVTHGQGQGQ
jgi:hypothetical protein